MTTESKPFRHGRAGISCCVAVLLALLIASPSLAQSEEPARDADHAKRIMDVMEGREFELAEPIWDKKKTRAFCRRLEADLRTQTGVTHVEPVARAKYYDDPVFKPFRDLCPGLELNGVLWGTDRPSAEATRWWEKLTEAQRDRTARAGFIKFFGTRNFKMFRLDLDGDPANGEEHVFYSERFYKLADQVGGGFHYEFIPKSIDWNDLLAPNHVNNVKSFGNGGFTVIDLGQCKRGAHRSVNDPYSTKPEKIRDAFSGIFDYRGRSHFYNVSFVLLEFDPRFHGYAINVDWFKNGHFTGGCALYEISVPGEPNRSTK